MTTTTTITCCIALVPSTSYCRLHWKRERQRANSTETKKCGLNLITNQRSEPSGLRLNLLKISVPLSGRATVGEALLTGREFSSHLNIVSSLTVPLLKSHTSVQYHVAEWSQEFTTTTTKGSWLSWMKEERIWGTWARINERKRRQNGRNYHAHRLDLMSSSGAKAHKPGGHARRNKRRFHPN